MSLAEFLLARIAEDSRDHGEIHRQDCHLFASPLGPFPCNCRIPARVLAECEAKRQIVQEYAEILTDRPDSAFRIGLAWAVRTLALTYAEHPDYRQEWKP